MEENFLSALSTNKMETDKLEQSPMATILSNLEDFLAGKLYQNFYVLKSQTKPRDLKINTAFHLSQQANFCNIFQVLQVSRLFMLTNAHPSGHAPFFSVSDSS